MAEVKIIWSEESLNDVKEIIDAVDTLKVFPLIGRIVPEYDNEKIREVL